MVLSAEQFSYTMINLDGSIFVCQFACIAIRDRELAVSLLQCRCGGKEAGVYVDGNVTALIVALWLQAAEEIDTARCVSLC